MHTSFWIVVALALFGVLVYIFSYTSTGRLLRTGILILRVTPYTQSATEPQKGSVLVAGDSTGYGTGATRSRDSIAGQMGNEYPHYSIENMSVNGLTTEGLRTHLSEKELHRHYDLLLLQIGANDILQNLPLARTLENLDAIFVVATAHADHVILMTAGNIGAAEAFVKGGVSDAQYEKASREARIAFDRLAKSRGVTYVDLFEEPEQDLFLKEPVKFLAFDGLHPSSAGYAAWYAKLLPALKEIL